MKFYTFLTLLLWNILHILVTTWYWVNNVLHILESYFITCGLFKKYKSLDLSKLRYLAIAIESEEAHHLSQVIELLHLVADIGVKHVCLFDIEGNSWSYKSIKSSFFVLPNCSYNFAEIRLFRDA